jgi:hypothetical protein
MILRSYILQGAGLIFTPAAVSAQSAFDHSHSAWCALLKKHVVLLRSGQASNVARLK